MWLQIANNRWYNRTTGEARSVSPFLSYRTHQTHAQHSMTVTVHYQNQKEDPATIEIESNLIVHVEFDVTRSSLERTFTRQQVQTVCSSLELKEIRACIDVNIRLMSLLQLVASKVTISTHETEQRKKQITLTKKTNTAKRWSLAIAKIKQFNQQRYRTQKQRDFAVAVLQCSWRIVLARRRVDWKKRKTHMLLQLKAQKQRVHKYQSASVSIQSIVRGYLLRKKMADWVAQDYAATCIQKVLRGHAQRERFRMASVTSAILAIQCLIRVWRARTTVAWKDQLRDQLRRARHEICAQERFDTTNLPAKQQTQRIKTTQQEHVQQQFSQQPQRPLPSYETLKRSIGMSDDELVELRPILNAASETIQRQYHILQAQRRYEWKRQVKIQKMMVSETKDVEVRFYQSEQKKQHKEAEEERLLQVQVEVEIRDRKEEQRDHLDPLKVYERRHNSVQLHAHTACMLIQAAYRSHRTRCHMLWMKKTMEVMLSRRVPFVDRPLLLPHTVMAEANAAIANNQQKNGVVRRMSFTRQDRKAAVVIQSCLRGKLGRLKMEFKRASLSAKKEIKETKEKQATQKKQNKHLSSINRNIAYTENPVVDVFYALSRKQEIMTEKDVLHSLTSPRVLTFLHPLMHLMDSLLPTIPTAAEDPDTMKNELPGQQKQHTYIRYARSNEFLTTLLHPSKYQQMFRTMVASTSSGSITLRDFELMCWWGLPVPVVEDVLASKSTLQQQTKLFVKPRSNSKKQLHNRLLPVRGRTYDIRCAMLPVGPPGQRTKRSDPIPVEALPLQLEESKQLQSSVVDSGNEESEETSEGNICENIVFLASKTSPLLPSKCGRSLESRESAPYPLWLDLETNSTWHHDTRNRQRSRSSQPPQQPPQQPPLTSSTSSMSPPPTSSSPPPPTTTMVVQPQSPPFPQVDHRSLFDIERLEDEERGSDYDNDDDDDDDDDDVSLNYLEQEDLAIMEDERRTKKKRKGGGTKKKRIKSRAKKKRQQRKSAAVSNVSGKRTLKNKESATLRALMSGSNLSLYQTDFMLSVLRPNSSVSVLLSPGRCSEDDDSYDDGDATRPRSATRNYHKKEVPQNNKEIEFFEDAASLVFPWQAQMFTSEWEKIVKKSCELSMMSSNATLPSAAGHKSDEELEGIMDKMVSKNRQKLRRLKRQNEKRWLASLPALPNASDLMKKCTKQMSENKIIEKERHRFMRLYGGGGKAMKSKRTRKKGAKL